MTTTRQRLSTAERRHQLLHIGLDLFGSHPYTAVSIDEIASNAGISKGLIYHYFGGKQDFYAACVQEAATQLLHATELSHLPRNAERGAAQLLAFFEFVEARAHAVPGLFSASGPADAKVRDIIDRTRQAFVDRTIEHLDLPTGQPLVQLAMRTWVTAVQHAAVDWVAHPRVPRHQVVFTLLAALAGTLLAVDRLLDATVLPADVRANLLEHMVD
jgi:AcrR family transcriptional regulator